MRHLFLLLLLAATAATAQKRITMSDAILQERTKFRPTTLSQVQWIPGTEQFSHIANGKVVITDASRPIRPDSLDLLKPINVALRTEAGGDSLASLPPFTWQSRDQVRFTKAEKTYQFDIKQGKLTLLAALPPDADRVDAHTAGKRVAYTRGNALYIADGTNQIEVARSESKGILYGTSVHRDEFGISKGTYWSPDGGQLAFYRMDESMVTEYPVYVLDSMPAQVRMVRYPYAGATSHNVTIGIYRMADKTTRYLQTGVPADQYLTNISWTPDNKYVMVAVVNREQNHMWLRKYDANTGQMLGNLFEETGTAWVEPEHPAEFLKDGRFIWQSEKDGYNHLYLYAADGKLIENLTSGKRLVTANYGLNTAQNMVFFQWADTTGLNRYISVRDFGKNPAEYHLGSMEGTQQLLAFQPEGKYAVLEYTNLTTPRQLWLRQVAKPPVQKPVLLHDAPNPNEGYAFGKIELSTLRSASGIGLNARTILPHGFDAAKKYPVLVYVYNGPHVQLVTNSWMGAANLWMQRMAQEGYIVYTIDGRGSSNRGRAFESAIHRQLGTCEVADQLEGVNALRKLPYIDTSRIAVYGWSYGGFMTTSLLTRPEAKGMFKCGVAGGAVTDWRMYEIMYTERYMDTPQENPEGYKQSSTFTHLPNLTAPLLMIHGTSDDVVTWQHTLRYSQECVRRGIQLDYFPYSEHLHNVRGKDRVHLFEKIEKWIAEKNDE